MKPDIAVLISARKNSKYLAKFLIGYFLKTHDIKNTEVLVMLNAHDDWNEDLVALFSREPYNVRFFEENKELGRSGLHEYFNELAEHARADWLVYFCEDHYIIKDGWDSDVRRMVGGSLLKQTPKGKMMVHDRGPLNPNDIWVLVPRFDNVGAMNHIVSKGFVSALDGRIGNHGWIDSYINDLINGIPHRRLRFEDEMFTDFSHYKPNPMSDAHLQSVLSVKGKQMPEYDSDETRARIDADLEKLKRSLG